ncbi:MAG: pyridoxal phosphate-dependent aminotransferase [Myxococcota bacterium]
MKYDPKILRQAPRALSTVADRLERSEILTIAYDVRARAERGEDILNLTVGDFSSREFPVPTALSSGVIEAIEQGHTNYPPAPGLPETREAIVGMCARRLGLEYPIESVCVVGGARPAIAGTYLSLVDPGDVVVYGLPSWNNTYYAAITGAEAVEIPTHADRFFFPRPEDLEPHLGRARLLCLNSPQNPTGTVIPSEDLARICRLVVAENERRRKQGTRELFVMFDQVYWALTFEGVRHQTPMELVPEIADHAILVDGISKGFAATGLRVGWAIGPTDVIERMMVILTHLGCWAPRPEQRATAKLLNDDAHLDDYLTSMRTRVHQRLQLVAQGVEAHRARGWNVECIQPQGAIYLSVRLDLIGRKNRRGQILKNDEDIRRHVLDEAGIALVPFRCFGVHEEAQWFRASVGVASVDDCASIEGRLGRALDALD